MGIGFGLFDQGILIEGEAQGKGVISGSIAGKPVMLPLLLPKRVPLGLAGSNDWNLISLGMHHLSGSLFRKALCWKIMHLLTVR